VHLTDRSQQAEPASEATVADITDARDTTPADRDSPSPESEFRADNGIVIDPEVPELAKHALADIFSASADAKKFHRRKPIAGGLHPLAEYAPLIPFAAAAPSMPRPRSEAAWKAWRRATTLRSKTEVQADWIARNAAIIYHRQYIVPHTDFDSDMQPIWARAVAATNKIRNSDVIRRQLIDSAAALALLPQQLWTTANDMARLNHLRTLQRSILRYLGPGSDKHAAEVVRRQALVMERTMRRTEERVSQLERLASVLEQADAAVREEATVRRLASLDEMLLNVLGNAADIDSGLYSTERTEIQEVIDQANEALRSLDAT